MNHIYYYNTFQNVFIWMSLGGWGHCLPVSTYILLFLSICTIMIITTMVLTICLQYMLQLSLYFIYHICINLKKIPLFCEKITLNSTLSIRYVL